MVRSRTTPRRIGKCTLTSRTSSSGSAAGAPSWTSVLVLWLMACSFRTRRDRVEASQEPTAGGLRLGGVLLALPDRPRAARRERARGRPRQVVHHGAGDGVELLAGRGVQPRDRAQQAVRVRVARRGEEPVPLGPL